MAAFPVPAVSKKASTADSIKPLFYHWPLFSYTLKDYYKAIVKGDREIAQYVEEVSVGDVWRKG